MKSMTENRIDPNLVSARPGVAITISRRFDPSFVWDGNGPNPEEDGFSAFDVTVKAQTIIAGKLYEGSSVLGGSYFKDNEPFEDVHGYYPQMLEEALAEMDSAAKVETSL